MTARSHNENHQSEENWNSSEIRETRFSVSGLEETPEDIDDVRIRNVVF